MGFNSVFKGLIQKYIIYKRNFHRFNPLNPELNPICSLLALLGAQHFLFVSRIRVNIHESVHRNNILIQKSQQDAHVREFILSDDCSKCFGYNYHPSSGAQINCNYSMWQPLHHIVFCCYRGIVGTVLSVLWMAYATHSTLKPVPTLPR